jgi:hypothetical protein
VRRFIYISVPRAASTSVHHVLGLTRKKDRSAIADLGLMDNHARWAVIKQRYGDDEYDRRYKFSFVRNPWDRCVSWYYYHRERGWAPYVEITFEKWVQNGMPHHWKDQNGTSYSAERTPLHQWRFVADDDGTPQVNFIGRIDRLNEDMRHVCEQLGIAMPERLEARNASRERMPDYRKHYDDKLAARVEVLCAVDIALFEFSF